MARSVLRVRAHLYSVAREVLVASSFDEVVSVALATLRTLVPAWRHSVGLIDAAAGTLLIYAAVGDTAVISPGTRIPLERFGADLARLRAGEADVVQDVRARPDAVGSMEGSQLRGQVITPLLDDGVLVGTLNVGADTANAFDEDDLAVLRDLAELVGAALRQVRLRRELLEAHEAALAASRAKSVFLATMSHELRTPLNIILGYTELLTEDADARTAPDLRRIGDAAHHLLALVSDVLDLSKIESDKLSVAPVGVDPRAIVDQVASGVRPLVEARNNRWTTSVPAELPLVWGDPTRIRQILFNVVGNAAKFTAAGVVELAVRRVGRELWFEVSDTGRGIGPDDLERIFDPFTQLSGPGGERSGSGLGLAIARRLARLMEGDLVVRSELGRGSCFTLRLPVAVSR